jgi:hypothetical protein
MSEPLRKPTVNQNIGSSQQSLSAVVETGSTSTVNFNNPWASVTKEELDKLLKESEDEELRLEHALKSRNHALGFGVPLLALILTTLAVFNGSIFNYFKFPGFDTTNTPTKILILWLVPLAIALSVYRFFFTQNVITAQAAFTQSREAYRAKISENIGLRKATLREELFMLSAKSARVFFDDEERSRTAMQLSDDAGNALDNATTTAGLSKAQTLINQLNELVSRASGELRDQTNWQWATFFTIVIYIVGIVLVAIFLNRLPSNSPNEVFGVPLLVIVWGAAGSLGAILYRFYTEHRRIRFAAEFRWLIARPIIGIIMGAVVYLALTSGLTLLQTSQPIDIGTGSTSTTAHNPAFWIIAFLAGFSDKFYLGVIDLLVARTVRSEETRSNTIITERERIPSSETEPEPTHIDNIKCDDHQQRQP